MLTDAKIRNAKPADKAYKLADAVGLHLFVSPSGGKLWRVRYKFGGKEKLLSLGKYPIVGLTDARSMRDRARALLSTGKDPGIAKKQNRLTAAVQATETFDQVAREWHAKNLRRWSDHHASDVLRSIERDLFPAIGAIPIRELGISDILAALNAVEQRGATETAHRLRQRMSMIFAFAIASGKADNNPALSAAGALSPVIKGRQPAITDLAEARTILRRVDATPGHVVTKLAIRLLAPTAMRPGAIAGTPWSELPKGTTLWTVPAARMKLDIHLKSDASRDHVVPLSRQAIEVIETLRTVTGDGPMAFPNLRNAHKPMSENAMAYMLNRAGYHSRHVPHGWRSTFSTIMNEAYPADRSVIDFMLAHVPKDEVERAYNRSLYLPRRRELAQIWADLITDGLPHPDTLLGQPYRRGHDALA